MALSGFQFGYHGIFSHGNQQFSASDAFTLVAAVTGKRIKVYKFDVSAKTATTISIKSDANVIFDIQASARFNDRSKFNPAVPLFMTNLGEALRVVNSDTVVGNCYFIYKVEA